MKKISVALAALATLAAAPGFAADLAVKAPPAMAPVCVWCGWYAGVNAGGGWSQSTANYSSSTADFALALGLGVVPLNVGLKSSGAIGGGQIGYNWQSGVWVLGFEADIQGSGIRTSPTVTLGAAPFSTISNFSDKLNWFGTARVRLGATPASNWLIYLTGGLAFGGTQDSDQFFNPASPVVGGNFVGSANQTRVGWTLGAGTEWMFLPKWSLKAEYLYVDLGSNNVTLRDTTGNFPADSMTYSFTHRYNIARAGLNYHF